MARSKAPSKKQPKQQKRGIDFKKIKRKLGRKLPPPKNATNTEVKSKAIVLPEQSVASEKAGLAVSKKGLTLKELLQQTSHHNSKVRRDALTGIKDLFQKYPAELRLHRYAVMEKLRERIGDDDKVVREKLYQLLKTVIFPGCKEDNQGPFVSLMMAYIFNAMTHLAIDVRLMAFKFFDLVVQYYPPSFSLYAEKILQNYEDILRKNQFYLEDKGKLKSALAGLVRCLSLLPCDKRKADSCEKNIAEQKILHAFELDVPSESAGFSSIIKKLKDIVPVLVNCFQDFFPLVHSMPSLDAQPFDCMHYILQSIDLAVGFLVYEVHHGKPSSQLSYGGPNVEIWDHPFSSVLLKKLFSVFPLNPTTDHLSEKVDDRYFILNIVITEIFLRYSEWICPPPIFLEKFLEFIENALLGKTCSGTRSGKAVWEKHLLLLLCFVPKLVLLVASDWKFRLIQAFTKTFEDCNPESSLKLACLSAIEEMLIPRDDMVYPDTSDLLIEHQISWIRALPQLLILLGDKNPRSSQVVLHLLLRLGQCANSNSSFFWEYENMQYTIYKFYSSSQAQGDVYYGPFIRLSGHSQELSICSLYYFSNLSPLLLKSIAFCCLCPELEPSVLFRIVEVLHSAFSAGHIQISDHVSFFITLLSRFKVFPENISPVVESDAKISNRGTFKLLTNTVRSCLSQIGDDSLVFQILEQVIFDQLLQRPPLDNVCALLRVLVILDCKPTRISEQGIITLSNYLMGYLIDVLHCIPEDEENGVPTHQQTYYYYILPCFFLFDRSHKLLKLVLSLMGSVITESSSSPLSHHCTQYAMDNSDRINAVVSTLLLMHKDTKVRKMIYSFKEEMLHILQIISSLQSSDAANINIEERHKIQCAYGRLKLVTSMLPNEVSAIWKDVCSAV